MPEILLILLAAFITKSFFTYLAISRTIWSFLFLMAEDPKVFQLYTLLMVLLIPPTFILPVIINKLAT